MRLDARHAAAALVMPQSAEQLGSGPEAIACEIGLCINYMGASLEMPEIKRFDFGNEALGILNAVPKP